MRRILFLLPTVMILAACGSNESAAFKEAGCVAADENSFDEAAVQFDLAARSGDPEAVGAAIASQKIWRAFLTAGNAASLEEVNATVDFVKELSSEVAAYCGSKYDIE